MCNLAVEAKDKRTCSWQLKWIFEEEQPDNQSWKEPLGK